MFKHWKWKRKVRKIIAQVDSEIKYKAEPEGKNDWQATHVTRENGTGDWEDFALIYAESLLRAGLAERNKVWICIGELIGISHAVLAVIHDGKLYHIDNLKGLQRHYMGFSSDEDLPLWTWDTYIEDES